MLEENKLRSLIMAIKEFALGLREELWRERNPVKVSEKINMQDFSEEVKRQIIGYIEYGDLYDRKIKNYSKILVNSSVKKLKSLLTKKENQQPLLMVKSKFQQSQPSSFIL